MKKSKKLLFVCMVLVLSLLTGTFAQSGFCITGNAASADLSQLKTTVMGIGGGGALFEPAISPLDSNEMLTIPDMGGIYISHDKGLKWSRANLYGTVISAAYDPSAAGVVYAGGSGLYRSTDNGDSFELVFPRQDDVIARLVHNENTLQYFFTKSGIYDRNKYVKNILIDPDDSNHIFILCYSYKNGIVFESTDYGESFNKIFTYSKSTSPSVEFDFNELVYRKETRDIFVINDEAVIGYNLDSKTRTVVYESSGGLADVSTVYENGKTYFVIIEKTNDRDDSVTSVYYTNDFENRVDITSALTSSKPTVFTKSGYGEITYKYNFRYISATSLNNIYVTTWSYASSSSIKPYSYSIDGVIRYHDGTGTYLYGNPFHNQNNLSGRSWNDGNTYSLGIAASKQNEEEFMFTSLCGVYYAPDNQHIYARHSTITSGKYSNAEYITNGIDEQAVYGVYEDPFNEGCLLLLNTDLGLIRSENNGERWKLANTGIPSKWVNTIYDAAFDEMHEGVVYSLWSGRHNAPYTMGNETDGKYGGFAISLDGGKSWDSTYSSGLPENSIPVKMSVIYNEGSDDVTIYVAVFNEGFYVSYDSGKTFTEMNNGIERVVYKDEDNYKYIFAADIEVKDGHIFGMTARSSYQNSTQPGEVFEYIDGEWTKISLPKNSLIPRDIYYNDGVLYVSGSAKPIWDNKNGTAFNNYGGGVYAYRDSEFTQIFDESISTTSVMIDSKGTIFISDIDGNIYRKTLREDDYQIIYTGFHYKSRGIQLTHNDDCLYLASLGGGILRIENLSSLYAHECCGGTTTCTHRAICEICGEEYGEMTPHSYDNGVVTKEPTVNSEGEKTYTCVICEATVTEAVPRTEEPAQTDTFAQFIAKIKEFFNRIIQFFSKLFG